MRFAIFGHLKELRAEVRMHSSVTYRDCRDRHFSPLRAKPSVERPRELSRRVAGRRIVTWNDRRAAFTSCSRRRCLHICQTEMLRTEPRPSTPAGRREAQTSSTPRCSPLSWPVQRRRCTGFPANPAAHWRQRPRHSDAGRIMYGGGGPV